MLTITQIANNINLTEDFDADLEKSQFAWRAYEIVWSYLEKGFSDHEIFLFDGTKTIQISDNQTDEDYAPKVSNGQVVWYQYDGSDAEIFLYDGTKTIQLTDNTANDVSPEISNGQVLWYQLEALTKTEDPNDSQSEIYLYNSSQTLRLTDNETDDFNAKFYGNQIVWERRVPAEEGGDFGILLYNNGQTKSLTDNQTYDPRNYAALGTVKGNYILWTTYRYVYLNTLFVYDGIKSFQLTANAYDYNSYDTDGQNIVWLERNNEVYLYDGNTTRQITNDGFNKSNVHVSGNKIVWQSSNEVFLYDGNTTTRLTENHDYKTYLLIDNYPPGEATSRTVNNLLIDAENIVWEVTTHDNINDTYNDDIYIYRNGAVSPLATTAQNEHIFSLSGNKLLGYINDNPYSYDNKGDQVFLATWTDDTFPILENPDQYGASYPDLIETYGYNLDAFDQHYRQFGISEGRSIDKFDEIEYLLSNPDLIGVYGVDGKAATRHYIEDGYSEKRPLDIFKVDQYIASYSDLISTFGGYYDYQEPNNLARARATGHYLEHGYAEGRATDTFDELSYLAANSDLIDAFGFDLERVTEHYIQHGFSENRPLIFDASNYLAANTDLIDVLGSDRTVATQHYITSGYRENRPKYGDFDGLQYLASYRDVYDQFGVNQQAAINHFVDYGYKEGRKKDTFDEYRYLASNPDLIPVYHVDGYGATEHYLYHGITEKRSTTNFDPFAYMQANPDVAQANQNDPNLATLHYLQYGYFEHRSPAPGVNPF